MNIDKRWLLLAVALSAAVGAAVASKSRHRKRGTAHDRDYRTQVKSWENEGGNVAPTPASPAL